MTTPTKPTKEATTPLPVLTEALTPERVRELRDRQFTRVLNTPRPTIEELEKILQRDDVQVEILPNGEVRAVVDADKELVVALADHWLRTQAGERTITYDRAYNFGYRMFEHGRNNNTVSAQCECQALRIELGWTGPGASLPPTPQEPA